MPLAMILTVAAMAFGHFLGYKYRDATCRTERADTIKLSELRVPFKGTFAE